MLAEIKNKILSGGQITFAEALQLTQLPNKQLFNLFNTARQVREHFRGNSIEFCSIINAKSGHCSENCNFCAQSIHFPTKIKTYPLLTPQKILAKAREAEAKGVQRFSLVTSGLKPTPSDFLHILKIFRILKEETKLALCASLGLINEAQAVQLATTGVSTYHHNLESSENFFPQICTTHTYKARLDTILAAQKANLRVCAGGLLGLGETWNDRLQLAFKLRELQVASLPLNILQPIKGTPLANIKPPQPLEILKAIALFRLILPQCELRLCGGRQALHSLQPLAFLAGVNALLVGNYLTTTGKKINDDQQTLKDLGLQVGGRAK